jgi:hypothetical protein
VLGNVDSQVQDAPRNAHGVVGSGQAGQETGRHAAPAEGGRHCGQPYPEDEDIKNDRVESHVVFKDCEDCKALKSFKVNCL